MCQSRCAQYQSRCVSVPVCPISIVCQSRCVPVPGRVPGSPTVSQSHCALYQFHYVPVALCTVPVSLCTSPTVSRPIVYCTSSIMTQSHCVPVPLCSSPIVSRPIVYCTSNVFATLQTSLTGLPLPIVSATVSDVTSSKTDRQQSLFLRRGKGRGAGTGCMLQIPVAETLMRPKVRAG